VAYSQKKRKGGKKIANSMQKKVLPSFRGGGADHRRAVYPERKKENENKEVYDVGQSRGPLVIGKKKEERWQAYSGGGEKREREKASKRRGGT